MKDMPNNIILIRGTVDTEYEKVFTFYKDNQLYYIKGQSLINTYIESIASFIMKRIYPNTVEYFLGRDRLNNSFSVSKDFIQDNNFKTLDEALHINSHSQINLNRMKDMFSKNLTSNLFSQYLTLHLSDLFIMNTDRSPHNIGLFLQGDNIKNAILSPAWDFGETLGSILKSRDLHSIHCDLFMTSKVGTSEHTTNYNYHELIDFTNLMDNEEDNHFFMDFLVSCCDMINIEEILMEYENTYQLEIPHDLKNLINYLVNQRKRNIYSRVKVLKKR